MENITVQDVLDATKGTLLSGDPSTTIDSISTNSQEVGPHTLFVPLLGERVNAHKFIESALETGAATLTSEHESVTSDKVYIKVPDTLKAMQQLATYYRNRMNLPIVGVTGSVGKTTTREMIAHVLKGKYQVFETIGNQNSQVGVPLTLDRLTPEDEVGVLEMGMSEPGQITILGEIIRPNIGVVTNVGVSHIEMMGTRDAICKEKLDIQNHLREDGCLFLNGDNDMIRTHIDYVNKPYEFYGFAKDCAYRAENLRSDGVVTHFTFLANGIKEEIVLGVLGDHNVSNALVAIAIGLKFNVPMDTIKRQLSTFSGQRQNIFHKNGYTVVDDAYNASPDSMKASLKILSDMDNAGRKIAVLSDMLELGPDSPAYHKEVGHYLATTKITDLYTTGSLSDGYITEVNRLKPEVHTKHFDSNEELIAFLQDILQTGDAFLIKGSNGMNLKEVSKSLE